MKKGLSIARKVASRDVIYCCRDEERAYRSREGWPRGLLVVPFTMSINLLL